MGNFEPKIYTCDLYVLSIDYEPQYKYYRVRCSDMSDQWDGNYIPFLSLDTTHSDFVSMYNAIESRKAHTFKLLLKYNNDRDFRWYLSIQSVRKPDIHTKSITVKNFLDIGKRFKQIVAIDPLSERILINIDEHKLSIGDNVVIYYTKTIRDFYIVTEVKEHDECTSQVELSDEPLLSRKVKRS